MSIPVSQIYITDKPTELPPLLQHRSNSVKAAYPNCDYTLYNGEMLRSFIEREFDREVVTAFDRLRPYAYKSDLGRYCLLLKKGGWYFDIGVLVTVGISFPDNIVMLVFREASRLAGTTWAVLPGIIYSKPANIVFQKAIELIISNCKSNYYGLTAICPTGPNLFGEALALTRLKEGVVVGDFMDLTPTHQIKNRAFVLPNGTIFAWSKPSQGGDLQTLGGRGTNNYNSFWQTRTVYEPEISK